MKVKAISDLHGNLPQIEKCDLLLIAGDISPLRIQDRWELMQDWMNDEFYPWVESLPCDKVVFVAGNHDFYLKCEGYGTITKDIFEFGLGDKLIYLEDNSVSINNLVIYGTPWCTGPMGWPFCGAKESHEAYDKIERCDILLTHQPPKHDKVGCSFPYQYNERNFGSDYLYNVIVDKKIPIVVCGHIHSGTHNGVKAYLGDDFVSTFYNASLLDEDYNMTYDVTTFEI